MPIVVNGQKIETDDEGFLADRREWNEHVAKELARAESCELTRDHWEVIHFLRAYYQEYQVAPSTRVLTKAMGKALGANKGTMTYLLQLFPEGTSRQICKFAGLPKPGCSDIR